MSKLSIPRLVLRRLWGDKALLAGVFIGMSLTTTLSAAAPIYLESLSQLSFNISLDSLSGSELRLRVFGPNTALAENTLDETEKTLDRAIQGHLSEIYSHRERFLKSGDLILGREGAPIPPVEGPPSEVLIGQFFRLSNLESHVTLVEGRMAGDAVLARERGPEVEVVVGAENVKNFQFGVGDVFTLAPDLQIPTRVTARVVGVIEPDDLDDGYWSSAGIYLEPGPLGDASPYTPPGGVIVDERLSPVTLFVSEKIMASGIGGAYPGTIVLPVWDMVVDRDRVKGWPLSQSRRRFESFQKQLTDEMPGSSAGLGVLERLLNSVDRKSFFASVPLLLLLGVMVAAVLFYLSMTVSYLVSSRQDDSARLRTRGVGTIQLLRLYVAEGLVIAFVAAAAAPLLALGAVAAAGKLPYFREMTAGGFLPLQPSLLSIVLAGAAGVVCWLIYVAAGLVGARVELLVHKLRSSRPPSIPFFHRYYMDVAVLIIGGLAFLELRSRGHFVSGGLLRDVQLNETLLLTPALFLVVVALLFIRFFPMVARFVAGESPKLVDLLAVVSLGVLAPVIAAREIRAGSELSEWMVPAAILGAIGISYVLASLKAREWHRWSGLAAQVVLVWLFFKVEPLQTGELTFVPAVGLLALVPAQLAFLLLRASTGVMPVWLSVGLWRMARSPLQYSWLVLLLVLATGLGVLSTTVGGTLERSQLERIQYDIPTDLRVKVSSLFVPGGIRAVRGKFDDSALTKGASLAFRSTGSFGHLSFQVVAVEPEEFGKIAWYRDDFSSRPLSSVMSALQANETVSPLKIPAGATEIGAWVKPQEDYPSLYLWMVIRDGSGDLTTVSLGELGEPKWQLMTAALPRDLKPPISLASVQIYEPSPQSLALVSFQSITRAESSAIRKSEVVGHRGFVLIDEIHANGPTTAEAQVLEDFEGGVGRWTPIFTSFEESDTLSADSTEAYDGQNSGVFEFGLARNRWVRGFYRSRIAGPYIPVVLSSALASASGLGVRDYFVATISGRLTPLVVMDIVSLFPTMGPEDSGFLLADLDLLLGYLNLFGHPSREEANELYIKWEKPGVTQPVSEIVGEAVARRVRVEDGAAQLSAVLLDPLATAGWRTMVLVSLGVILLAAGLGYVAYVLLLSYNSRLEMGFLRSLGLSRLQLVAMLTFEHFTVAALGLGLGTWAGLNMSRLTVSPLAVTDAGDPVVPPFFLLTEWALLLPVYVALIAIFLGSLVALALSVNKLELHTLLRAGEK